MSTPTYTSFDDVAAYMRTVIVENGVGAITGPVLQDVLGEILDTSEYLVNISNGSADARALAAEGWAVGTQRGVPVEEGSPYYENNSLYWSQQVNTTAGDLARLVQQAQQAISGANDAAADCGRATTAATDAASLAERKAGEASDAASLATEKAGAASGAASLANTKAGYAEEQGNYARDQINGAKGDYESLDARFDHVDEISMYWQTVSTPSSDPDLVREYDRVLAKAYQMMTDMGAATSAARSATTTAEQAGRYADQKGDECDASTRRAVEQTQRAAAAADACEQVTGDARSAAADAAAKSTLANNAASAATAAASYANEKGLLADQKATLAANAASNADEKAAFAQQKGEYAQSQIDGAKGDYESLDARFDHVDEISMYWHETETPSSDPALVQEYIRVLGVAYQCITDLKAAMSDTNAAAAAARSAADQALAAISQMQAIIDSSRAAVENCNRAAAHADQRAANCDRVAEYSTQRGDYAQDQGDYARLQGNYAKQKADEIENAKGGFQTLAARLNYIQGLLEKAMYFQEIEN